jgi:hypothetical protein
VKLITTLNSTARATKPHFLWATQLDKRIGLVTAIKQIEDSGSQSASTRSSVATPGAKQIFANLEASAKKVSVPVKAERWPPGPQTC